MITHASLFSGIGAAELAAKWMGWRNAFHCEIQEFPRTVLRYWFPEETSYEDITKTDFAPWRGRIDVLTGGFPCFISGTPVLTGSGFVPIEEVRAGDSVLSMDGKYHKVECLMTHQADEVVRLKAQGMFEELKCTPNHPFYVKRKNGKGYSLPEYIHASRLKKGDKVGYPVHEGTDQSYSPAFWKLIGTWIADGWTDNNKRKSHVPQGNRGSRINSRNHKVIICCGKKNIARLHHVIQKAGYNYTLSEDKDTYRCIICDSWLCDFLQDFGKYAYGKRLSPQCYRIDNERKKALLEGWFADGYADNNGNIKVTTVSRELVMGMAQIARDVYKRPVSVSRKTCNRVCVIEGRTVNERPQYCLTIPRNSRYGFYENGIVWCNVKSISMDKEANQVFNLSVYEEHSYNVYGLAVHNCQPFSCAGKRQGADDDRYLWPEMLRAIREIQPSWVVGENVAGILSMVQPGSESEVGGETSLFGEDNEIWERRQQYVVETVCQDLENEGYSVQPFVIPACAVGAPHRRDRVWFIARRVASDTRRYGGQEEAERGRAKAEEAHEQPEPVFDSHAHPDCTDGRHINSPDRKGAGVSEWHVIDGCRAKWTPADSDGNRLRKREDEQEPVGEREGTPDNRACGQNGASPHAECGGGGKILKDLQPGQPDGQGIDGVRCERDAADSDGERLSLELFTSCNDKEGRQDEDRQSEQSSGHDGESLPADRWRDFPAQPPVRRRHDGLSPGVDVLAISWTRWRTESIKAYGNAIVPQVMYEIFRAIEIEETTNRNSYEDTALGFEAQMVRHD